MPNKKYARKPKVIDVPVKPKASMLMRETIATLALDLWCPWCDVLPGHPCQSPQGRDRAVSHYQRRRPLLLAYRAGMRDADGTIIRFPGGSR